MFGVCSFWLLTATTLKEGWIYKWTSELSSDMWSKSKIEKSCSFSDTRSTVGALEVHPTALGAEPAALPAAAPGSGSGAVLADQSTKGAGKGSGILDS